MERYERAATKAFLIILGLSIPIYFLLYAASGHEIDFPKRELLWMLVAVLAFCLVLIFRVRQAKGEELEGIVFLLLIPVLIATSYAGVKVFWSMVLFDFDDDVVIPRILSYVVPVIFVISSVLILVSVVRYKLARKNIIGR
jgi:hypothetical protein